jgi:hypothetical protein
VFDPRIAEAVRKLKLVRDRVVTERDAEMAPHRERFALEIKPFQDKLLEIQAPIEARMLAQFDVAEEEYRATLRGIIKEQEEARAATLATGND